MKKNIKILLCLLIATINYPDSLHAQLINTIAGNGISAGGAELVQATSTSITKPEGIFVDMARNVYFIDHNEAKVKKVSPDGITRTIAGSGGAGYTGDGGPATAATFQYLADLFVDTSGNVYICDKGNYVIRKVTPSGIISTICGTGSAGFSGDGGPATAAKLFNPWGITGDRKGNIYISDRGNQIIRKVNAAGIITTIAGTVGIGGFSGDGGPAILAQLNEPVGMTADTFGRLYFADAGNQRIRMIDALGTIHTIAGSSLVGGFSGDGSAATAAELNGPFDVHTDPSGEHIYIADAANSCIRLVKASTGIITTFAGTGTSFGFLGDGGLATSAICFAPSSVYTTDDDVIYLTDDRNHRVRRVAPCIVSAGVASIACSATVCVGASVTATDATVGGVWSASNTSVSIDASTGVITGTSTGTVTISYTVLGKCGQDLATTTIAVADVPSAAPVTGLSSVCESALISLSDAVSGGTWSSSNTTVAAVSGGIVAGIVAGTTVILYTLTNICGTDVSIKAVTVNPLPPLAIITGSSAICEHYTTTLSSSLTGGVWSSSNMSVATVSAGIVSGVSTGTAIISYSVTNICGIATATKIVNVGALPVFGAITGPPAVCSLSTALLTPPVSGGTWSSGDPGIASVNSSGLVTGLAAGTAMISYSKTNSCGISVNTFTITVELPKTVAPVTGGDTACVNSAIVLSDVTPGGVWSSGASSIATVSSTGIVTGIKAGSTSVFYTLNNSCGTVSASAIVDFLPVPVPVITVHDKLLSTAAKYLNYQWYIDTTPITYGVDTTYTVKVSGKYSVKVTDVNGCSGFSTKIEFIIPRKTVSGVTNTAVGIGDVKIFPNPATNELHIDDLQSKTTYSLLNTIGQTIQSGVLNAGSNMISIQSLGCGIYMLELTDETGKRSVTKLVKQ